MWHRQASLLTVQSFTCLLSLSPLVSCTCAGAGIRIRDTTCTTGQLIIDAFALFNLVPMCFCRSSSLASATGSCGTTCTTGGRGRSCGRSRSGWCCCSGRFWA